MKNIDRKDHKLVWRTFNKRARKWEKMRIIGWAVGRLIADEIRTVNNAWMDTVKPK